MGKRHASCFIDARADLTYKKTKHFSGKARGDTGLFHAFEG